MRILNKIMLKTRARCPCCGTRLNENSLNREIDLDDGQDVMEQEIGGYGGISTGSTSSFEDYPEIAQYFLENINEAKEYLEEILGIEDEEEFDEED
ncbi:MAG: hypothetical protein MAG458_01013 [Nitrosopumilus sp.]|nr:hypothetical protein [Nitrosopumilus sp.]